MKNMKKIICIIITGCLLTIWSCTNLEETIYHEIVSENFYQNEAEIQAAMMRPFVQNTQSVSGFLKNVWLLQELPSDILSFPQKGPHGYDGGNWIRFHRREYTTDESQCYNSWDQLYAGIGYVNNLLTDFEKLNFEELGIEPASLSKEQCVAELRTIRAYFYWILLDLFGDVPITTTINESSPESKPRSEVFAFVEQELTESLPNLSEDVVKSQGRISKWGAYAILAYMYMNAEVYTGTQQLTKAIAACDAIYASGKFAIDKEWYTPFCKANETASKENIFTAANDPIYAPDNTWFQRFGHYAHQAGFGFGYAAWNSTVTTPGFYSKFDKTDKRGYVGHLYGPQYKVNKYNADHSFDYDKTQPLLGTEEFKGFPLIMAEREVILKAVNNGSGIKVESVSHPEFTAEDLAPVFAFIEKDELLISTLKGLISTNGGQEYEFKLSEDFFGTRTMDTGAENIGARSVKYEIDFTATTAGMTNDWVIFRLSRINFIKAEALMRQNGNVATDEVCRLINEVKERAYDAGTYVPYTPATLTMDELLLEMGREFAYEGWRRVDLVRFDKFVKDYSWWDYKPSGNAYDNIFPIPHRRLNNNPNLKPNDANANRSAT